MKSIFFLIILSLMILGCTEAPNTPEKEDDYTKKMEKEHANDKPTASPLTEEESNIALETKDVVYAKIGEKEITGYIAYPQENKDLPGIIVIQEWWGLNDNIKAMTRKIAAQGYVALAVDLYNGGIATTPKEAQNLMKEAMDNQKNSIYNLRQAYDYLTETHKTKKIGSIGWCFGGHWSLRTGMSMPDDVDAVVIYYGKLLTEKENLSPLQMPILGIFGGLDKGIPVETVKIFENTLKELGKDAQIYIYPEANHAFANPSGTRYHEESATDAWKKTMDFFAKHLK